MTSVLEVKACSACGLEKPFREYYRNKFSRGGVNSVCKPCKNARTLTSRQQETSRAKFTAFKCSAKYRNLSWDIDVETFFKIVSNPCTYCGYDKKISLDRIDNDQGYFVGNVNPCCRQCNVARSNFFTVKEMMEEIGPAIRRVREKRRNAI